MKNRYVRTEDGHIIDTQNVAPFMIVDGYIDFNRLGRFKIKSVDDEVEKLFDCYVDYCEKDEYDLVSAEKPIRVENHEIYGAIRVGENLKNVAKENDKGEFELL